MDPPAAFNIADLFEAVADRRAGIVAVIAGAATATYLELDSLASHWATVLADLGAAPGERVASMLRNHLHHVAALLGAFKLRAVPLNVNVHYTAEELRHLLHDADPALIVCEDDTTATVELAAELASSSPRLPPVPVWPLTEVARRVAQAVPARRRTDREGDDRYLLYTGGTTGLPKGVEWHQADLFFAALGGLSRVGPQVRTPADAVETLPERPTRVLVACPLMHGTAQWVTLGALLSGGTVVLFTGDGFDAPALLDLAEREQVAHLVVVGDAFAVPIADALEREPGRWALDELVTVASGGASLAPATARRLLAQLPGAVAVDGYGASETGGHARRIHVPGVEGAAGFRPDADTALIGFDGTLLPTDGDELGRIGRRGHLPIGYRNDPARTAVTFPTIDGERWALTGDFGRWSPDGTLLLVGRGERIVNSGGEKVDALEVESVVRSHPAVADAMVVGVPDPRFGEVVGVVVRLSPGASLSVEQLARFCRGSLARFKLPRYVLVADHLPRTPTGKLDYGGAVRALTERHPPS